MSFWAGVVMAPDRQHRCVDCGRDLWLQSRRFRNPIACPTIWVGIDGLERCSRCDDKHATKTRRGLRKQQQGLFPG